MTESPLGADNDSEAELQEECGCLAEVQRNALIDKGLSEARN